MMLQLRVIKTALYKIFYSIHIHIVLNNKHTVVDMYKAVRVLYNLRTKISYMCINYLLSAEMDRREFNSGVFSSRSVVLQSYSTDKEKFIVIDQH